MKLIILLLWILAFGLFGWWLGCLALGYMQIWPLVVLGAIAIFFCVRGLVKRKGNKHGIN